jgi:hypothetical protein
VTLSFKEITFTLLSRKMISQNIQGNVIIQPDENIYAIVYPDYNNKCHDNVIIQPDNINIILTLTLISSSGWMIALPGHFVLLFGRMIMSGWMKTSSLTFGLSLDWMRI